MTAPPSGAGEGSTRGARTASRVELPDYSPKLMGWFAGWLRRYFARNFTAVRISRSSAPPPAWDRPVIFYSNHPSWWDPILFMVLGRYWMEIIEGYGPIDAAMLEKYRLFRRLGLFGVEADTRRGAATFLRTSLAVLERPGASLWLTAEGAFTDPRQRPLTLAPGLGHLAARLPGARVMPLAIEYPFWNERRPEALVRLGEAIEVSGDERLDADAWTDRFRRRLEETMDGLAEESASRDPARFRTLIQGSVGVGGFYDLGRRLRSWLRGERFRAAHGEEERPE